MVTPADMTPWLRLSRRREGGENGRVGEGVVEVAVGKGKPSGLLEVSEGRRKATKNIELLEVLYFLLETGRPPLLER